MWLRCEPVSSSDMARPSPVLIVVDTLAGRNLRPNSPGRVWPPPRVPVNMHRKRPAPPALDPQGYPRGTTPVRALSARAGVFGRPPLLLRLLRPAVARRPGRAVAGRRRAGGQPGR